MAEQSTSEGLTARVARHRTRTLATGSRRVEVTVAACDAGLIRAVAGTLRAGGEDAKRVRDALTSMTSLPPVQTGAELVAFLRASPLVGEGLMIERDLASQFNGRILPFDLEAAVIWGEIMGDGDRLGRLKPMADAQIAAVARRHNLALATRNMKINDLVRRSRNPSRRLSQRDCSATRRCERRRYSVSGRVRTWRAPSPESCSA